MCESSESKDSGRIVGECSSFELIGASNAANLVFQEAVYEADVRSNRSSWFLCLVTLRSIFSSVMFQEKRAHWVVRK